MKKIYLSLIAFSTFMHAEFTTVALFNSGMIRNETTTFQQRLDLILKYNKNNLFNSPDLYFETFFKQTFNNKMKYSMINIESGFCFGSKITWKPHDTIKLSPYLLYTNKYKDLEIAFEAQIEYKF